MESILVKIFATALALSQVMTAPDAVRSRFDRAQDQELAAQLLRAGCAHMRKAFDIEDINVEDLIATAMDDPQAVAGEHKAFHGINFADLQTAYRQFCKNEKVAVSAVDLGAVIDFYDKATADLPDHSKLKGMKLPGASVVLDRRGERFAEVFEENQRRVWVALSDVPEHVQKAFLAAEDRRFYQHKGIDERGLIRAFIGNLASSGRPQGGSTITQQIVKNLLVGEDLTYERKIREMIVASRVEHTLSKAEILELYLNSVYLGRGSWGIELAARSYFGKPAKELTLEEGALLAGLTKGPNYFNPDRHPLRAQERLAYVLSRMQEDGVLAAEQSGRGLPALPTLVAYERPRRDIGFHFVDQVAREAKSLASIEAITANSYTVRSTINPQLQRAVEAALQEGLSRYERSAGRVQFRAAEANLSQAIQRIDAEKKPGEKRPAWQRALASARLPLYDVHWTPAIVLEKPAGKKGEAWRVGLADGRVLPLSIENATAQRKLALYDVVLVRVADGKGKIAGRAELRVRPMVQGMAVVLENKTGRILAMTGGFSYPLSQLNRATQAVRQPGSAIKPLSYLGALRNGLQPNTLVSDEPITLPPLGGGRVREQDYWSPKNYDGGYGGILTLRRALENSRNLATVHLLDGGIESNPEASLDRLCKLALEAQIYRECLRYYPFVLGAQPVRPVDLAAFYATIANEGLHPTPHVIDSIERNGVTIYRHDPKSAVMISSVDRAAFYQLKTMLQGVLARGTARSISGLAPYVAGKTGTTDGENDAWFVGFTNDVTVAIWIGYDNADGKRRTLGGGATGGHVAVPIFEPVIQAAWANVAPKAALAPPSPEAKRHLACKSIDLASGEMQVSGGRAITECFRIDRNGQIMDTQYQLVSRGDAYSGGYYSVAPNPYGYGEYEQRGAYYYYDNNGRYVPAPRDPWRQPGQYYYGQFGPYGRDPRFQAPPPRDPYGREYQTPQRIDPGYIWGNRRYY
ncbi:MAG TPA: transglycosylase domain-containing protein [Xanthobacteraceae bacterium]|jgi:penicillin-binding protein 1A|nr:transglycosylase domain-containing protein [Xanthobacteraceae bacterium]